MLGSRPRLLVVVLPALLASGVPLSSGCSASDGATTGAPPPAAPAWEGAPTTLAVYDGRVATMPVAIRAADPATLTVSATAEGLETEIVPADAPAADGLWRGTLRVRPGYALPAGAGPVVTVEIADGAGGRLTHAITLDVHKLGWQRRLTWDASGPQTREHGVFLYDRDARAAYLLQGSGYSPQFKPIEDSWRLDVASGAWSPWTPTGDVPVAGGSRRAANVPGTKKFYVYGGYIGFEATAKDDGDLYLVDLADAAHTFTRLKNVGAGSARELHAVAYDAKADQLVVFGGIATKPTQEALDDTWTVKIAGDTATWTQLGTSKAPTPRYGSFTAFDAETRRLVVWSGAQAPESQENPVNPAQDGWALDLAASPPKWSKLAPAGEAPSGRRNGCSMHDPAGRRLFVYGGTSDGRTGEKGLDLEPGHEAWTKLELPGAPPLRSSGFGFATENGDVTCAFGNDSKTFADVTFLGYADPPK